MGCQGQICDKGSEAPHLNCRGCGRWSVRVNRGPNGSPILYDPNLSNVSTVSDGTLDASVNTVHGGASDQAPGLELQLGPYHIGDAIIRSVWFERISGTGGASGSVYPSSPVASPSLGCGGAHGSDLYAPMGRRDLPRGWRAGGGSVIRVHA